MLSRSAKRVPGKPDEVLKLMAVVIQMHLIHDLKDVMLDAV